MTKNLASGSKRRMSKLKRWRRAHGLTLQEVADLTGLDVPRVSRYERGERTPSPERKVEISRRLGTRIAELFEVES